MVTNMNKDELMKAVFACMIIGAAADLPFGFLPKVSLLAVMGGAMVVDFVTGIVRAKLAKEEITEKALTQTVIKFCQYGGAIAIGLTISFLSMQVEGLNSSWKYTPQFMSFFNNSLLVFIIHIEIRSIVKNLIRMDSKSQMAKTLLGPVLKILSISIKNNPIAKLTIETDEEVDVKQKTVRSKNIIN